jgi:hypothetical protein
MKKRLLAGALGLAALVLAPQDAEALGLLRRHCCDHRCSLHLCIRQYNAFSPVCFGNINCMGCNPFAMGNGGMPCGPMGGGPMPSVFSGHGPGPCCSSSGCCDPGALPAPGPGHPPTHMPLPGGPGGEQIGPPAGAGTPPNPLPPGANLSYYRYVPQQAPVYQASYQNYPGWPYQAGYGNPAAYGYGYGYGQGYPMPYPAGYYPQGYGYPVNYYPPMAPMGGVPNYWYGGGYGQGY